MTEKEIVKALQCISTVCSATDRDCLKCGYFRKWFGCDADRLSTDAADLIERLTAENVALREGASLGKVKRPQKIAYEKSIEFLRAVTDGQSDEIKRLRRELEWKDRVIALAQRKQAEAETERDAALADLADARSCKNCKYACDTRDCSSCKSKTCKCRECHLDKNAWEWRGLPEAPEEGDKHE